jgi:hypothetical protein
MKQDPVEGGMFKFEDHNAAIGLPFRIGETQRADRNLVNDRKDVVYDMYQELRASCGS